MTPTKEGWITEHPTSQKRVEVVTAAYCSMLERELRDTVQALTDAQTLLFDARRHANTTPDVGNNERDALVARLRDVLRMGRLAK